MLSVIGSSWNLETLFNMSVPPTLVPGVPTSHGWNTPMSLQLLGSHRSRRPQDISPHYFFFPSLTHSSPQSAPTSWPAKGSGTRHWPPFNAPLISTNAMQTVAAGLPLPVHPASWSGSLQRTFPLKEVSRKLSSCFHGPFPSRPSSALLLSVSSFPPTTVCTQCSMSPKSSLFPQALC